MKKEKIDVGKLNANQVEELGKLKKVIEIKEEDFYKFINEIRFYRLHGFESTLLPEEITNQLDLVNQWGWYLLEFINVHMHSDEISFIHRETFGDTVLLRFRYRIVK